MQTKENILKTALELFLKKGYEKTSMNEIAGMVGISKPAVYHHFKSKEELAINVIDYFEQKVTAWNREQTRNLQTFPEFLHFFISSIPIFRKIEDVILDKATGNEISMGFNDLILALSKQNETVKNKINTIFHKTQNALKTRIENAQNYNLIRSDLDAETIAVIIHSIIEGMGMISNFEDEEQTEIYQNIYDELMKILS
ncbi:MAG TPA: TetR/AcrR family transcriptional regulator [Candidatus Cloacimonetes bacterium]|nr:TetR/AcrR family transcriptional regulator [Candidatus Cloacimonadota bacterium]